MIITLVSLTIIALKALKLKTECEDKEPLNIEVSGYILFGVMETIMWILIAWLT